MSGCLPRLLAILLGKPGGPPAAAVWRSVLVERRGRLLSEAETRFF